MAAVAEPAYSAAEANEKGRMMNAVWQDRFERANVVVMTIFWIIAVVGLWLGLTLGGIRLWRTYGAPGMPWIRAHVESITAPPSHLPAWTEQTVQRPGP
jgi:hypothetical protein